MAPKQVPARDIVFEIETAVAATWAEVGGLTSVTPDYSANSAFADTTEFSSGGRYSGRPMQRGGTFAIDGKLKLDPTTGAQDPGQARVETLAKAVGEAGMGRIRFRYPMEDTWTIWSCYIELGNRGAGGTNDMGGWAATFTRDEDETTAAVA